ncbi:protochlorophyllide-dependent translocon component 52, chloroplastic-like isoform X2 [Populus nigra]|uniref:protochlorophyllide-dependent translocon component 52, chloroplastic-like isoform X2 n=1 Tax=Populus nigra TaxID=3691 RepID=UPI002B277E08|nr:protochlorophyllide-dependent translocon component 52, chloroplastic-like isoform X2 [Populus nigra]
MVGVRTPYVCIPSLVSETQFSKPKFMSFQFNPIHSSSFSRIHLKTSSKSKLFTTISSSPSSVPTVTPEPELEVDSQGEKFDWYAQWYPIMLVCDLDKRVPHAKRVMGLDIVLWWDRNENTWKVFGDACPHRLAPLSEGRIDQWGRLQCVYHGWCFNGSGDCKFIPQASPDGPPVHTFKKACVAVYPSTVHHDIVWFWPNSDPQYKDIITKKQPPTIPELDDPSFIKLTGCRDIPYGYEILIENLMDPAHVTYAHYGIIRTRPPKVKADREGGCPVELSVKKLGIDGFLGDQDQYGTNKFIAPCVSYAYSSPVVDKGEGIVSSDGTEKERKIMDIGLANWQKACFVPTKSDAFVVGFRRWLKKYAGGQVDWRGKYSGALPPTPPREELMDRYWSHVVSCRSCSAAYNRFNALEVVLQVASLASIGIATATKQNVKVMVAVAVLCFAGSKWLAHFIYKNFHYHDYKHALH